MGAHSSKGPSSAARWVHCTPSVKLCADMPDVNTTYAQEGTDAHAVCEWMVKTELGQPTEDPRENLTFYNEEMQEYCESYRDFVMEKVEQARLHTKDVIAMVEQRIEYERFVKDGFGTADFICVADGVLEVVDFKYGMTEVSGIDNEQMKIYALGALELFDDLYDIHTVRMTIYQPRLSNISSDEISRDDLYEWAETVLRPAAEMADKGEGDFHTGKWCRFCKARHVCRERAKKNLELAAYEFQSPPLLSDEEISEILDKVDNLISWANDVKEYALQEAIDGKQWPGRKLVEGRSIRKYVNEKLVAEKVKEAGYEPYCEKLLGVTEMQKMLGKKKFEEILGELVVKPTGKPVLVSRDDKRPEMNNAKSDFKEDN